MTQFEMQVDRQAEAVVLRLSGEFDISCRRDFEARLRRDLGNQFRSVLVDLRDVTFVDSTGLGLILELWSRSRRDGWEFAVVRPTDQVHQTFLTAGLGALPIVDALPGETLA